MKELWKTWQKNISMMFGAIVNPKSKGQDVASDKYYIECKQRDKSFTISTKTWNKIYWEAVRAGREPLIALKLGDSELIICDLEFFRGLDGG